MKNKKLYVILSILIAVSCVLCLLASVLMLIRLTVLDPGGSYEYTAEQGNRGIDGLCEYSASILIFVLLIHGFILFLLFSIKGNVFKKFMWIPIFWVGCIIFAALPLAIVWGKNGLPLYFPHVLWLWKFYGALLLFYGIIIIGISLILRLVYQIIIAKEHDSVQFSIREKIIIPIFLVIAVTIPLLAHFLGVGFPWLTVYFHGFSYFLYIPFVHLALEPILLTFMKRPLKIYTFCSFIVLFLAWIFSWFGMQFYLDSTSVDILSRKLWANSSLNVWNEITALMKKYHVEQGLTPFLVLLVMFVSFAALNFFIALIRAIIQKKKAAKLSELEVDS